MSRWKSSSELIDGIVNVLFQLLQIRCLFALLQLLEHLVAAVEHFRDRLQRFLALLCKKNRLHSILSRRHTFGNHAVSASRTEPASALRGQAVSSNHLERCKEAT